MSSEVVFDEVQNPRPYPVIYWLDKVKGKYRYLGWQAFYKTSSGRIERRGEISKSSDCPMSGPWPRDLKKMMKEDAALYASSEPQLQTATI